MYPHHVFNLEPAGTFGMYPICYQWVSGGYFQPEPAMYSRCFRWFPGPLAPSVRWWRDVFPKLHLDDQLWANMIRGGEQLHCLDRVKINDLVLVDLLQAGIMDWMGENNCLHQVMQAIHHSTAIYLCFLPCVMDLECKVGKWQNQVYSVLTISLIG